MYAFILNDTRSRATSHHFPIGICDPPRIKMLLRPAWSLKADHFSSYPITFPSFFQLTWNQIKETLTILGWTLTTELWLWDFFAASWCATTFLKMAKFSGYISNFRLDVRLALFIEEKASWGRFKDFYNKALKLIWEMSKNFLSFVLSYNPSSIIIRTCPDTDIEKCPSIVLWFSDWSLHWWVVFSTNPLIIQNNLLIFLSMTASYCFDFWSKYCSEYHYSPSNSYKGQVKNNEAKVWQYGHETWKMNFPFDAPASFFPSHKWL